MKEMNYFLKTQLTLDELQNQIETTGIKLKLSPFVVEKDIYVTKIIHVLSHLDHDYYRLIFQGGICLAKAHKLVPRMSEDCDFRMEAKTIGAEIK